MFQIIYRPDIINSIIDIAYGYKNELEINTVCYHSPCGITNSTTCGITEGINNNYGFNPQDRQSNISYFLQHSTDINPLSKGLVLFDDVNSSSKEVPIILGKNKANLFYLTFDNVKNIWLFYHGNKQWSEVEKYNTISTILQNEIGFLFKTNSYYGAIINNMLEIIQYKNEKQTWIANCFCDNYLNLNENILHTIESKPNSVEQIHKLYFLDDYSDLIFPTINGFVHFNSASYSDFIFTMLTSSTSINNTMQLINIFFSEQYYKNIIPAVLNFKTNLEMVYTLEPKKEYSQVYQLFDKYDKKYFDIIINTFQTDVMSIFNNCKLAFDTHSDTNSNNIDIATFIGNFINRLKIDLSVELAIVYHRLRCFPYERTTLYKQFPNHPYIKLLKIIHQYFIKTKKNICINEILNMYNNNVFTNNILTDAIASRNDLFVFMYELFLDTNIRKIKPKYKFKYTYFPFKIFSPTLFIMEHMLSTASL